MLRVLDFMEVKIQVLQFRQSLNVRLPGLGKLPRGPSLRDGSEASVHLSMGLLDLGFSGSPGDTAIR